MFSSTSTRTVPRDIYTDLPPVDNQRLKLSSSTPFTPEYVKSNVTRSSDSSHIYASRVQGRQILLDNPARESKAKKEREAKIARRLTSKTRSDAGVLGKRIAAQKGVWKLKPAETKFDLFLALHKLWMDYMSELLALPLASSAGRGHHDNHDMPNAAGMHAKLVKADFHGSVISVRRSKNPCLVGISGIVIHETENAFKIVTKADKLKLIPKQNSTFTLAVPLYSTMSSSHDSASSASYTQLTTDAPSPLSAPMLRTVMELPHIELELYGNQFCFRSADRASRKFKHKETIEL